MKNMRGQVLIFVLLGSLAAEQLPIRVYSTADGLPHNTVLVLGGTNVLGFKGTASN